MQRGGGGRIGWGEHEQSSCLAHMSKFSLCRASSPPWYLGVFASLAPKSVWRGVKTSGRFFGVRGQHAPVVIPFCEIFFLESWGSILRSTLAPGMREGTLLLP